jgi:hypothetical protein
MFDRKIVPAILSMLAAVGCGGFGKVNQGRVIDYDAKKGLVTFIQDSNYKEPGHPRYDVLPPVTVAIPRDRSQMGAVPEAGRLISLDSVNNRLVFFDPAAQTLKTVEYTLIEQRDGVYKDDPQVAGVRFPVIDRENRTVTIYVPRQRQLVKVKMADEYLALPDSTWRFGDEIRYYYKDPQQALRLMNITRTDVAS